ncbi:MAG: hypothetical protein GY943_00585, partial [Chloroflexi bacterium]|nr:hypothetical protein [Chloroflexota bacterium]
MTESLLQVQFANKTIDIYCEHHDLYHTIQRHLRHALSQNGASCATYFIKKTEDEQWTLQRDSITIVTATSILYLLESLYHDVTLTFTKLCNQHLLFHAAGVATRKSGILLCGASGSGKSTFTARLIADGY